MLLCCCKVLAIVWFEEKIRKKWKNQSVESFVLLFALNHVPKFQQIKLFCAVMMTDKVQRFQKDAYSPFPLNVMRNL